MLSKAMLKELENEFKDTIGLETVSEAFVSEIKVKGLRLSQDEKELLALSYLNDGLDLNNETDKKELVLFNRKIEEDIKKEEKAIKQFEKTLSRLVGEDMDGYVHDSDYYEYEVIVDGINYCGAVEYAKYWYRTRF